MYLRTIHHIVDPTVRSTTRRPLSTGLPCDRHLSWTQLFAVFRCRSVFSRDGAVARPLTSLELSRAYDLPPFLGSIYTHHTPESAPWLASPPVKLLVHMGNNVMTGGVSEGLNPAGVPPVPPVSIPEEEFVEPVTREHDLTTVQDLPLLSSAPTTPDELSVEEQEIWSQQYLKSVKADDAATPVHLWNERVWKMKQVPSRYQLFQSRYGGCPLDSIRELLLRRWRINVRTSFQRHLREVYGPTWYELTPGRGPLHHDLKVGRECLWHAAWAEWWEWSRGSRPFFWRWPPALRDLARDGFPPYVSAPLPHYTRPQPFEKDAQVRRKVAAKLEVVRDKRYVCKGTVTSLTSYFSVPKGDQDIRLVYDASKSGLNKSLWAPNFGLPTVDTLTRGITSKFWMGDLDIGEMFLNFPLHPSLHPVCGIDLRPYVCKDPKQSKTLWERWARCVMGLKPSPYWCIKFLLYALEMIRGPIRDPKNLFYWEGVRLNLPGDSSYNPMLPKLLQQGPGESMPPMIVSYVDDMRAAASSREECWQVLHVVSSRAAYLGVQVATRKTRPPSPQPGPWAGSLVVLDGKGVGVRATPEKWRKTKDLLRHTQSLLSQGGPIDRKLLESYRGSLVYLQRTYPAITPYVKGFHLTIDGWRPNRDDEGWKIPGCTGATHLQPPTRVAPVSRLSFDVEALLNLFQADTPPVRWIRGHQVSEVTYSYADASGTGFGRSMGNQSGTQYTHGVWTDDEAAHTSNYRELSNLVLTLEEGVASHQLKGTEIWIFTDNSTAEAVFWKGHSASPLLNDLALRLRKLEMDGDVRIMMIHVPGSRMIRQGTDGLSRGDLTEGVMTGQSMLTHVPVRFSAFERQPRLLQWVTRWLPSPYTVLQPDGWFWEGHGIGGGSYDIHGMWFPNECPPTWFVWAPPPVLADIALEELETSRHKRHQHGHLILIPRLMTFGWRKKMGKLCDVVWTLPPGPRPFWPESEHEPLILGLTLPFALHSPWQAKLCPEFLALAGKLHDMWSLPERDEWHFLRQLCLFQVGLGGMSERVVP
jgi:hypothetical protein